MLYPPLSRGQESIFIGRRVPARLRSEAEVRWPRDLTPPMGDLRCLQLLLQALQFGAECSRPPSVYD